MRVGPGDFLRTTESLDCFWRSAIREIHKQCLVALVIEKTEARSAVASWILPSRALLSAATVLREGSGPASGNTQKPASQYQLTRDHTIYLLLRMIQNGLSIILASLEKPAADQALR